MIIKFFDTVADMTPVTVYSAWRRRIAESGRDSHCMLERPFVRVVKVDNDGEIHVHSPKAGQYVYDTHAANRYGFKLPFYQWKCPICFRDPDKNASWRGVVPRVVGRFDHGMTLDQCYAHYLYHVWVAHADDYFAKSTNLSTQELNVIDGWRY